LFGTTLFLGSGVAVANEMGWTFCLFQLTFAGTAATIVSGAMAERTGFKAYLAFTLIIAVIIYPIYGHWVWGGSFVAGSEQGWLARLGYVDFAGSSVVHVIGAGCAAVGAMVVGPRLGRYDSDGNIRDLESGSLLWSCLGVLILWFGWYGFNGGSALVVSAELGLIVFNTNIAAACGGIVAFAHAQLFQARRQTVEKTLGGVLGGLVAVTACANLVSPTSALALGCVAGLIHNWSYELVLKRWRIDDVVGAIPVHGFCGVWGILGVALFGAPSKLSHGFLHQLGIQALGATVAIVWACTVSVIALVVLKAFIGIRVDPMREINGLTLSPDDRDEDHADDDFDALFDDGIATDAAANTLSP